MGSGYRLGSRIYTNSFASLNQASALHRGPQSYFGFENKTQYSYNVYHQLADNSAGFGARGARWARTNKVPIAFRPPYQK